MYSQLYNRNIPFLTKRKSTSQEVLFLREPQTHAPDVNQGGYPFHFVSEILKGSLYVVRLQATLMLCILEHT
jgi:hypothetical protein